MKTSIFIRSYSADFGWLAYCLRSLQKFATGFHEIVIAVPQGEEHALSHLTAERVIPVHNGQPGYLAQQVSKLNADLHCSGDFILHIDSDCILTRPVTPETMMRNGKPIWLMTPWEQCPDAKKAWYHVMAKLFLDVSEYDFMRRSTIMVPRFAYAKLRGFIEEMHGYKMDAYVMNQPNHEFTEYNALGFYLWKFHREAIAWRNTATDGVPEPWEMQSWSYGGITPEIRDKMEAILK